MKSQSSWFLFRNYISQKSVLHVRLDLNVRAAPGPRSPLGNEVCCLADAKAPGVCSSRPVRADALSRDGRGAAPLWWSLSFCGRPVGLLALSVSPSVGLFVRPGASLPAALRAHWLWVDKPQGGGDRLHGAR